MKKWNFFSAAINFIQKKNFFFWILRMRAVRWSHLLSLPIIRKKWVTGVQNESHLSRIANTSQEMGFIL